MSRSGPKKLSDEDRILWNRVARTAVPLKGRAVDAVEMSKTSETRGSEPAADTLAGVVRPPATRKLSAPRQLDRPVRQKLAKGRVALDASVDLHGMTQAEAHRLLLAFLHQARDAGLRHVLVITGKGSSSAGDGVLRRSVPDWFATGPFRLLVSGYDEAGRHHGGGGALYVRLRRPASERP
jgi:DNA-nicking Smr family endonuclease